jgi:hypothetical protein
MREEWGSVEQQQQCLTRAPINPMVLPGFYTLFILSYDDISIHSSKTYGHLTIRLKRQFSICSETTLTGESRYHIITPWGLNLGPSSWEAKGWPTRPVRLCVNAVRLQALHRATPPPPAVDYVSEAGRRTCSECDTGTEELCEIKWYYHIVGTTA